MQAKYLIIASIVGILALAIFDWFSSSHTYQANQASQTQPASSLSQVPTNSLGDQPKLTLDKANAQINQANQATTNKLAQADKAIQ